MNFGQSDGKIIFEPCIRFDPEEAETTLFETISSDLASTHQFNESGAFYKHELFCGDTSTCYIKCVGKLLNCFGSHFHANQSAFALFECESRSSCQDGIIDIQSA